MNLSPTGKSVLSYEMLSVCVSTNSTLICCTYCQPKLYAIVCLEFDPARERTDPPICFRFGGPRRELTTLQVLKLPPFPTSPSNQLVVEQLINASLKWSVSIHCRDSVVFWIPWPNCQFLWYCAIFLALLDQNTIKSRTRTCAKYRCNQNVSRIFPLFDVYKSFYYSSQHSET
jgi:hypothetical protein